VLALQRSTHHTLHALSTAVADLRLSAAEINVLANLAGGGSLNVSQLSAETGTKPSTLTNVLDRLADRGYLTRELDPQDRRSFRLALTTQGTATGRRISAAIADLESRALSGLSASQLAGFHAVMTALAKAC
jgi:MarR family transcriptional regulator, organic hydroperoxide resistance regulator